MSDLAARTTTAEASDRGWRMSASRAIHPSVECGDGPLVATIAAGLASVSAPRELTATVSSEHNHQLLLSTELYDAWLVHWPPGTGLAAHDHGGSAGAFAVVSGELAERRRIADGRTVEHRVGPGDVVSFGATDVHAVTNRGARGATSVHVYSPPLGALRFSTAGARSAAVDAT